MAAPEDLKDVGKLKKGERKLSPLDKLIQQTIGDDRTVGRSDDPAKDAFPAVWDWLTRTDAGRDYIMQPGRLTIQLAPDGVVATVLIGDLGYLCEVVCPYLGDVLQALESALTGPNPPIRVLGKRDPKIRKRKSRK